MTQWLFKGSLRLDGVDFIITADTKDEAIAKAKSGDYDEYDEMGATAADWEIDPASGELNE
jgi:hypothetical protein